MRGGTGSKPAGPCRTGDSGPTRRSRRDSDAARHQPVLPKSRLPRNPERRRIETGNAPPANGLSAELIARTAAIPNRAANVIQVPSITSNATKFSQRGAENQRRLRGAAREQVPGGRSPPDPRSAGRIPAARFPCRNNALTRAASRDSDLTAPPARFDAMMPRRSRPGAFGRPSDVRQYA